MSARKRQFTASERYGVWEAHGHRCVWCREPVIFKYVELDHVLPESLLEDMKKLQTIKTHYGLGNDFEIDDWKNWVPLCRPCNNRKSKKVFEPVPAILEILTTAAKNAPRAAKIAQKYADDLEYSSKIQVLIEEGTRTGKLTKADVREMLKRFAVAAALFYASIENEAEAAAVTDVPISEEIGLKRTPYGFDVVETFKPHIAIASGSMAAKIGLVICGIGILGTGLLVFQFSKNGTDTPAVAPSQVTVPPTSVPPLMPQSTQAIPTVVKQPPPDPYAGYKSFKWQIFQADIPIEVSAQWKNGLFTCRLKMRTEDKYMDSHYLPIRLIVQDRSHRQLFVAKVYANQKSKKLLQQKHINEFGLPEDLGAPVGLFGSMDKITSKTAQAIRWCDIDPHLQEE